MLTLHSVFLIMRRQWKMLVVLFIVAMIGLWGMYKAQKKFVTYSMLVALPTYGINDEGVEQYMGTPYTMRELIEKGRYNQSIIKRNPLFTMDSNSIHFMVTPAQKDDMSGVIECSITLPQEGGQYGKDLLSGLYAELEADFVSQADQYRNYLEKKRTWYQTHAENMKKLQASSFVSTKENAEEFSKTLYAVSSELASAELKFHELTLRLESMKPAQLIQSPYVSKSPPKRLRRNEIGSIVGGAFLFAVFSVLCIQYLKES